MGPRKRPISEDTKTKDSISNIYPHINEKRTPLPRYWSHEDKCEHLGLSNRNLIVTYKGLFDHLILIYIVRAFNFSKLSFFILIHQAVCNILKNLKLYIFSDDFSALWLSFKLSV